METKKCKTCNTEISIFSGDYCEACIRRKAWEKILLYLFISLICYSLPFYCPSSITILRAIILVFLGTLMLYLATRERQLKWKNINLSKFAQFKGEMVEYYGLPIMEIKPGEGTLEENVMLFDGYKIMTIGDKILHTEKINGFNVREEGRTQSAVTHTSTGSALGRGLIGGVAFGGIGALAGASTASTNTFIVDNGASYYDIDIYLDDLSCPVFTYRAYKVVIAQQFIAMLHIINKKKTEEESEK